MTDHDQTIIQKSPRKIKNSFHIEERGLLVVLSGPNLGKTCLLDSRETLVGRDETCDLTLEDDGISKEHFIIRAEQGYFFLEDLGSSNGTYLDGKKVRKKQL
ncbi:MAG: FHA domain-containing protein, partial [Spirochaetales bacterium]|nr:FHA domain-containing protein [Spirochaetales bacterium]